MNFRQQPIPNLIGAATPRLSDANMSTRNELDAMMRALNANAWRSPSQMASGSGKTFDYYGSSPDEQFKEAARQYLSNPGTFKSSYPNAAEYLSTRLNLSDLGLALGNNAGGANDGG